MNYHTLAIIPGYTHTFITLFDTLTESSYLIHNHEISKQLFQILDTMMMKSNITFNNIDYIAFYQGPSPLTTTRALGAIIKGLIYNEESKNLILLKGTELYYEKEFDGIILEGFGNYYYVYDKIQEKRIDQNELKEFLINKKKIIASDILEKKLILFLKENSREDIILTFKHIPSIENIKNNIKEKIRSKNYSNIQDISSYQISSIMNTIFN